MAKTLTATDRKSLIRLASTMGKGSPERRAILAGLQGSSRVAAGIGMNPIRRWKGGDDAEKLEVIQETATRASDIMRMVEIMAAKTPGVDANTAKAITRKLDDFVMRML